MRCVTEPSFKRLQVRPIREEDHMVDFSSFVLGAILGWLIGTNYRWRVAKKAKCDYSVAWFERRKNDA